MNMVQSRIIIPRRNILEFLDAVDENGGVFVVLDNGMATDVFLDERNNYWSITNNTEIIVHLNYYGLQLRTNNLMLKQVMFNENDDYNDIRFEIQLNSKEETFKIELTYHLENNVSINKFLLYDDTHISIEQLKEIDEAICYFLLEIVGVQNSIYNVLTNETLLIDKLIKLGYENKNGFINAYDNLKIGDYLLEKKLEFKK